jgi:type IV pilus assembly protein PilW
METTVREHTFSGRRGERGLTIVELMVGMVIALIGTIIIFQVFAVSEDYKRRTTGGSDAIQSANFSLYQLERQFSWVGAGMARVPNMWGCLVTVTPAVPAPPAPFDVLGTQVRMAPILIRDGGGAAPDVIVGIGGGNDSVNTAVPVQSFPGPSQVTLNNTVGVKEKDWLLLVEQEVVGKPCLMARVTTAADPPFAPAKVGLVPNPFTLDADPTAPPAPAGPAPYSGSTKIANLGSSVAGSPTRFQITAFTVGTDPNPAIPVANVLLAYDVLNGGAPISLADNVVNLQAVYGVAASATDPKIAEWRDPGTAPWDFATLTNGSAVSADLIARIRAVRVAVAARNAQWEKDVVTPGPVVLFPDLGTVTATVPVVAKVTVTLTGAAQQYRYKVFDEVIPLRNMLIANN